jgi:RecB family exonuclease
MIQIQISMSSIQALRRSTSKNSTTFRSLSFKSSIVNINHINHINRHRQLSTKTKSSLLSFQNTYYSHHYKLSSSPVTSPLQKRHSSWPQYATTRTKTTLSYLDILQSNDYQLDPFTILSSSSKTNNSQPLLPMPKALSPSSANEFKNCPQSFLFQYILSIKQPTNLALARGSVCHSALEEIFDLEPKERTLEHLQNLYRKNWSKIRLNDGYVSLFDVPVEGALGSVDEDGNNDDHHYNQVETTVMQRDLEAERKWGNEALDLLKNYYQLEDPRLIPRPNPLEREIWVTSHLALDPTKGTTSPTKRIDKSKVDSNQEEKEEDTFYVRGIVDRLDYVAIPPSPNNNNNNNNPDDHNNKQQQQKSQGAIRIVDYKTGKAPDFKYSPAMNEKIANENMWQLKIYALLLREMIDKGKAYSKSGNLQQIKAEDIRLLRLMYLTSAEGEARYLDMDLGQTQEERDEVLQQVHRDLSDIWKGIRELVDSQDPRQFVHCDREWCFCHKIRSKFLPGSICNL